MAQLKDLIVTTEDRLVTAVEEAIADLYEKTLKKSGRLDRGYVAIQPLENWKNREAVMLFIGFLKKRFAAVLERT